jgi:anthranilate 1,2-dioxygenase small subunit
MHDVLEKTTSQPGDELYHDVAQLIVSYGHALDDGQIDRWPQFFTKDGLYRITTRENHDAGLPIGIMRCVGRGMMIDRVRAFHTANIFEPHTYNHICGLPVVQSERTSDRLTARSNFQIVRIMEDGRMDLFATGKYLDAFERENGVLKFCERVVVLDSRNVDILIVVPL